MKTTQEMSVDHFPFLEMSVASPRHSVYPNQLENSDPHKPCEDAEPLFYDIDSTVHFGAIFDGITRSHRGDGSYPFPSPARIAADEMKRTTPSIFMEELDLSITEEQNPDYVMALGNTLKRLNEHISKFTRHLASRVRLSIMVR